MKKNSVTRIFSVLLAVMMIFSGIGLTALAEGIDDSGFDTPAETGDVIGSKADTEAIGDGGAKPDISRDTSEDTTDSKPDNSPTHPTDDVPDTTPEKGGEKDKTAEPGEKAQPESKPKEEPKPTLGASGDDMQELPWMVNLRESRQASRMMRGATGLTDDELYWGSGQLSDRVTFGGVYYINSPMYQMDYMGKDAFCTEFNGNRGGGKYVLNGEGNNDRIKQILANYHVSSKGPKDYMGAQIGIWSEIIGKPITSWGTSGANTAILTGTNDYSKITYQLWTSIDYNHTQNFLTYEHKETPEIPHEKGKLQLKIEKRAEGLGAPLQGAAFRIEHHGHGVYGTFRTDSRGEIVLNDLPWSGTWEAFEIDAPAHYILDSNNHQTVYLDDDHETGTLTFYNTPYTGVKVRKVDAVTNEPLAGATIKLVQISTGIEYDGVSDGDGLVYFDDLEPGSYYAEEVVAPDGHVLNTTKYPVELIPNQVANITIPNQPYTGIEVTKIDANTGEKLAGATIKLSHISSGMTYTKQTGADGIAYFGEIPPGDYYVEEIQAPSGYVLNNTRYPLELQPGLLATITIADFKKDGLIIKKVDPDGHPIAGAVFELRRGSGQVITRETTNDNGIIYRGNLSTDTYVVEEIQAPEGYIMDPNNPQSIYIDTADDNKEFCLTFVNQKKPSIEITKVDADNPTVFLAGATFHISEQGGSKSWDIRTGGNGKAILENLEVGVTYVVEEVTSPNGYLNAGYRETIVLEAGKVHTIVVPNKQQPSLTLVKRDADTGILLGGATFRISKQGGMEYQDVTTDYRGSATLTGLEPGWYTIVELKAPDGYLLLDTPTNVLFEEGKNTVVELTNEQKPTIKLIKLDTVTRERLANATFTIHLKTNTGETFIGEYITDDNGEIQLDALKPGRYTIRETIAPDGYNIDTAVKEITVEAGKNLTVEFTDTAKSPVYIQKIDQDGNPLRGAKFTVKTMNGSMVATITTGQNGYAIVPYAEPGWYVVEEIKAPDGYVISGTPQNVELKTGRPVTVEFVNVKKPGLSLLKLDASNQKPLSGARFKVATVGGQLVGEYTSDTNGLIQLNDLEPGNYVVTEIMAPTGYVLDMTPQTVELKAGEHKELTFFDIGKPGLQLIKKDKATGLPVAGAMFNVTRLENGAKRDLGSFTTGENGTFFIPDMEPGNYVITEIKAPIGYILDATPQNIFVEGGKLNVLELYNTPYASLRVLKISEEDRKPLPGATFKLYDAQRIEVGTHTTNNLGEIVLPELPAGTYYIQEVKAPAGYVLNSTVHKIELIGGKTTTFELPNKELGSLRILKKDADTGASIYGVTFLLYDAKDNVLGEYTTDQNGLIVLGGKVIPGTYKLKEIKAADGYVLDETLRTITVKNGETTEVVIKNTPQTGRIQIVKVASEKSSITRTKKGDGLKGAEFAIYNEKLELVETITTDKDGLATSSDLPLGKYVVKEKKAPKYYYTDGEPIHCEIKLHNDLIRLKVENKPEDIEVSVTKRGVVETMCGEIINYEFSDIANLSNVELDEFYWHDKLPTDAVRIQSIYTGVWSEKGTYSIWVKTNLKGWKRIESKISTRSGSTIDVTPKALGLASNEYVTEFKFEFGTVEEGFHCTTNPYITVRVNDNLPSGYRFINKTDVGGRRDREWTYDKDTWVTVTWGTPKKKTPLPKTGF